MLRVLEAFIDPILGWKNMETSSEKYGWFHAAHARQCFFDSTYLRHDFNMLVSEKVSTLSSRPVAVLFPELR